jgi:hypothetical protein
MTKYLLLLHIKPVIRQNDSCFKKKTKAESGTTSVIYCHIIRCEALRRIKVVVFSDIKPCAMVQGTNISDVLLP